VSEPQKKGVKGRSILAVMLAVALGAGGIFVWMRPSHSASREAGGGVGSTLTLEPFVVNLTGEERAYLRVGITLGLSRTPGEKNEAALPVPLVRDIILSVLTTARPDQLLGAEGKQQLKTGILEALRSRLPQLGVEEVYFTEFLVQM
jgi:flagellar basal body-associated protein FliL